ncbi:MAG TPA: serine/threonine-protein kinase [Gemmataceae bacterium]|jgi:serine/threonine protein kinase|nr:serine/threonine-protein kinase [Gemmataceae bacterium]
MAGAKVERFLQAVEQSGLLSPGAVRKVVASAPAAARTDPQLLADHFIRLGRLSHYQARKLLDGAAAGLVLGPYQIVMPIGKGGMGTVYLARDGRSPRLLALKILPPKKARRHERLLARFRREMDLSRKVAHPNLTQTFDVGTAEGVYYIAMEYIAGRSLYRLVMTDGPLPVGRAAKLFAQAAAGLEHAHGIGLIHRDLKPSNILVTPRDQVKVLDLGLALIEGEETEHRTVVGGKGYIVGSMDYIPPEQTQDAVAVDARSDLYGLGCTMYFALTGQPPFPGGDAREKMRRHREEIPAALQELNPLIPADFAAIVHPLLAKRPEDRPASAAVLRQQLLAWADPLPPPMGAIEATESKMIAELEADLDTTGDPISAWDWVPTVSLAETAGGKARPAVGFWAELGWPGRALALALAALSAVTVAVLIWWAVRG